MTINNISIIGSGDQIRYAWQGLRRYQNTSFVKNLMQENQNIPSKFENFVKKQAEQIRYCLFQASEYNESARFVSFATSPLLYYYSVMSMALAEILFKQDGNSSLDKVRGVHGHHGLELKGADLVIPGSDLSVSATQLRAAPHERSGRRAGTFELWHRSAREGSVAGRSSVRLAGGNEQEGQAVVLVGDSSRMSLMPSTGLSLLDCYRSIPRMVYFMETHGIDPAICRAKFLINTDQVEKTKSLGVYIHPQNPDVISRVVENMEFSPQTIPLVSGDFIDPGYIFHINERQGDYPLMHVPNTLQEHVNVAWICSENNCLNEFGLYYVSFYILGNYARYFPDKWMREIENSTPLALSVMELVAAAEERMPMLLLGELSRSIMLKI